MIQCIQSNVIMCCENISTMIKKMNVMLVPH